VPVLYIFGKHAIDVEDAVEKILELIEDNHQPALLLYDVIYYHSAGFFKIYYFNKFFTMLVFCLIQ
jgi:diphthamide biosynthesis enzyme Dph1/Dph2-like protein